MSGIEFLRLADEEFQDRQKQSLPNNMDEAMEQINEYIKTQLPMPYEIDCVPACFDVTQNEEYILIGSRYGGIGLFSTKTKKMMKDIELSPDGISFIQLVSEDSIAIIITEKNTVYIFDFPSFYLKKTFTMKGGKIIVKPGVFKDTAYFVNSSPCIKVIEMEKMNERIISHNANINNIDVSDDGTLIALALESGAIELTHGVSNSVLQSTEPYEFKVDICMFSQFRRFIAAGFQNFVVKVWNIDSDLSIKLTVTVHEGSIRGLAFVNKSRYLVTGGEDNKIVVFDLKVEGEPFYLDLFDSPVLCFQPSDNYKKLYYSQDINRIMA